MSDLFLHSKKALSIALTITTIVWSVGLFAVAPLSVSAAAGDLIKAAGNPAVYLVDPDGVTIHPFPHANVYHSWGFPADFSSVITTNISGFSVGNDVEFRDGSLIRALETPAVYAVSDKKLRPIVSAEVFEALGYNYDNITWLPQSFLDKYGTPESVWTSTASHPDGTLIKYASSSTTYVIDNGMKRPFASSDVLKVNGYASFPLITIPASETYPDGSQIVVKESAYTIPMGVGSAPSQTTPPSGPTGSGVTVSVASSNPASDTILSDSTSNEYPQALIPMLDLNFKASSDGMAKITTIAFKRIGVASDSDIGNAYLYDGPDRLAEFSSFNDKVLTFNNTSGLFDVSAGGTRTVRLMIDLARGSTSVAGAKTIGFEVVSASDVSTSGGSVSGSFPLMGNEMTTAAVLDLGHVYATNYTTFPATIKADATGQELWRFTLTADSQDMQIRKIKMTMVGTIDTDDINNLMLEVGGVQVGTTQIMNSDKTVIFDLSGSPYVVDAGQSKIFILRGNMVGGASKAFKFTIQKSSDVEVWDENYEVFNTFTITNTSTAFAVVDPNSGGDGTNVSSGTITTGVASDSPTGNIPDGATGVTLAKFSFKATGEDVKVESLTIDATSSGNTLVNVKTLLDGSQIGTTDASLTADGTDSPFTYGNTFRVNAGQTRYITVVGDLTHTSVANNETVVVNLVAGSSNAQGLTTLTSLSTSAQSGKTLTVKSGTVTVTKNSAFGDRSSTTPTGTAPSTGVKIASFIITAGSGEPVDVTQIVLLDASTVTQMVDNFENIILKNSGGTQIGDTAQTSGTTDGTAQQFTFTPSTAIRINNGAQYVVDVFADIISSPADSAKNLNPVVKVDSVTATGATTSSDASYSTDVSLQQAYISAGGNLTITQDADTPIAQQVVMGSTGQEMARFKLAASADEDVTITDIRIAANVASGATGTFKNIKLYKGSVSSANQVGTAVNFDSTVSTTTYAVAHVPSLALEVPRNSNIVLIVTADISPSSDATTADTAIFALLPDYDSATAGNQESITAQGENGSSLTGASQDYTHSSITDNNVVGNTITVYATKVSVAFASDSPSGATTPQANQTVAKFVVTNSANVGNYAATVRYMNFAISHQGASKATAARVDLNIYKDTITSGNLVGTTSWAATENSNPGDTAIANTTSTLSEGTTFGFNSTEIAAGTSKTFWVTLDTNEIGLASNESISVNMAASDLAWRDGVIASDITTVNSLPLQSKTLTY